MTHAAEADRAIEPECWCCGSSFPESALTRLGQHPEVGVCTGCADYLRRRARASQAGRITGPLYRAGNRIRDAIIARGWHNRPVAGAVLRAVDRKSPW